jgi:hypothetical protein
MPLLRSYQRYVAPTELSALCRSYGAISAMPLLRSYRLFSNDGAIKIALLRSFWMVRNPKKVGISGDAHRS